jgi:hypothetical protein
MHVRLRNTLRQITQTRNRIAGTKGVYLFDESPGFLHIYLTTYNNQMSLHVFYHHTLL